MKSAKLAYEIQLTGSFERFKCSLIWKARSDNKSKFFAWTLIQYKILTADNLARRGWPHHFLCSLSWTAGNWAACLHLCLICPFAADAWKRVLYMENLSIQLHTQPYYNSIADWWEASSKQVPKEQRRDFNKVSMLNIYRKWKL